MRQRFGDLTEIREALKKDPNNPWALRAVGRHYLAEGYFRQAKDHYLQSVIACPGLLAEVILDYEKEIERNSRRIGPRLSLAGLQISKGEIDAAVLELEETLEINPKNVEAYNALGKIYLKQDRLDEAISLLERSLLEGIKDISLTEILAGAYLEKGRIHEAIKFYEEILTYRSGDKQILRVLGDLYTRIEDYKQAAKSYESMFSDDPQVSREVIQRLEELLKKLEGNIFIREILSDIYMRSLNPDAAVLRLREILRLDSSRLEDVISRLKIILKSYPGHPKAIIALAEALRFQGSFSEAVELYHDLAKTKPEFLEKTMQGYQQVLEYCPEQVLARNYMAESFLYKKQIKEALLEFEKMLAADPSSAEIVIRKCREIIKGYPQLLLAHVVLGRAYLAKGDLQRAALEAEGVVSVDKKFSTAYLLLGEAYFKMKLCRKAVEVLRSALSMDPYNPEIQENYQAAIEKELEYKVGRVKERIAEDPWKISLRLDLAKLYVQKGLQDEAIRELQVALRDQARAPFAANLLGCIYRGDGRFDLAASQFNRALELAPPELADFIQTLRFNLGSAYEGLGLVRKALKIYEKILQEDIDFGDLRKRVKYLKASSLRSIRSKALLAVFSKPGAPEIIALWGREAKSGRAGKKQEISLSFGEKYNTSGFEYFIKGINKAAVEEFQLAVQLDAKFATALNNLGVALLREGRSLEAKNKFEEALHLNPASVVYHNNLGVACFLLGQLEQSSTCLERAYTIDPELSGVCINFGDVCYLRKDIKRALDLYQRQGKFDVLAKITEQRLMYKVPD